MRVAEGTLRGTEGILIREPGGSAKLTVKIEHLGYATVEIDASEVEVLGEEIG